MLSDVCTMRFFLFLSFFASNYAASGSLIATGTEHNRDFQRTDAMCENSREKIQLKFFELTEYVPKKAISSHQFGLMPLSTQS